MSVDHKDSTPTVWKFAMPFPGPDVFTIDMPMHADVLTIQVQHGEPQIWALVNPSFPARPRRFRIAGTGHPIAERIEKYVGSFQAGNGYLVFHIFEVAS